MKVSLGSWAFTYGPHADHPSSFEETVDRLTRAGYDGVEITGFPPHVTLEDYPTFDSRQEIVRLLKEHNLGVSGYAADLASVNPTVPGNRQKYLDLFRQNVQMCADIGSPSIRVDTGAAPGSIPDSEYNATMSRMADLWHTAADIGREKHVRVAWEFEPGFEFNKPSDVIKLHDEVAHSNFKLLFDTCHAHMSSVVGSRQHGDKELLKGGIPELIDKLGDRIGGIHVSDSDGTLYVDETTTHVPIGQGQIDFKAIAPKLLALRDVEWWCIDLCFCEDSFDYIDSSLEFVRDLTGV